MLSRKKYQAAARRVRIVGVGLALMCGPVFAFQQCTPATFKDNRYDSLTTSSDVIAYTTNEDQALDVDLHRDYKTLQSITGAPSEFSMVTSTSHGELVFDATKATFHYMPALNFYGDDSFKFSELGSGESKAVIRTVSLRILSANDLPLIKTEYLNFKLNSTNNPVILVVEDLEDPSPKPMISADGSVTSLTLTNGLLEQNAAGITYTPNVAFRGVEQVDFYVRDRDGGVGQRKISITVENPFQDVQPALAVRASGCITCHANVRAEYITDFGYGNAWFMAQNSPSPLTFSSGNVYGDHQLSWSTSIIEGPVIVPKTTVVTAESFTGTLAAYIRAQEAGKTAPATVVEKDQVYIGAPTVAILERQFQVTSTVRLKFIPNDSQSTTSFTGLTLNAVSDYYSNTGELVCDGDVFVRGTVFLDKPVIKTRNGCRIHATGPIFLQQGVSYVNQGDVTASNNTNLQLVSARAVVIGVGLSHCEDSTGWYQINAVANPLQFRLQDVWTIASHITRSQGALTPTQDGASIVSEAQKLTGYKDASCYAGGRSVHLERLLVNAPTVQSRLTGNVSGVVITEVPMFALNVFSFEFDEVFMRVPVLPLLDVQDYLFVQ